MLLKDYKEQHTGGIRGLSNALCQESVRMRFLVELSHPNISVGGGTVHLYFQTGTAEALKKIAQSGKKIIINTGFRTLAQQYVLKQNLTTLVAPIGKSDHGAGRSVDIENWKELRSSLISAGFTQPYKTDLVHFDYPDEDLRSRAVHAFQNYHNRHNEIKLHVDGLVGQETLNALGNTPVNGYQPKITEEEIRKAFEEKDYTYFTVAAFQELYNKTANIDLVVDGVAGKKTIEAYKNYRW